MTRAAPHRCAGFTLIEVIIAMFVIALGIGALLATLTSSTQSTVHLRDKSFAEWVALNRLSESRLERPAPEVGVTSGDVDYAGTKWTWRREITDPGVAGILRINVSVTRASSNASAASTAISSAVSATGGDAQFPALATAYGFIGTNVAAPNGNDPSWAQPPVVRGAGGGAGAAAAIGAAIGAGTGASVGAGGGVTIPGVGTITTPVPVTIPNPGTGTTPITIPGTGSSGSGTTPPIVLPPRGGRTP